MHILVLGCGVIGKGTVRQFVKYSDADVSVADIDVEKAEETVQSLTDQQIPARQVDVSDTVNLRQTIEAVEPDVVANTIGPFYKFADNVYQACLDTGIDCVDVCDDIKGARAALSYHEDAQDAGISIVNGAGDSPGLTNIIAKYGAMQLDNVESIDIYWIAPQSDIGRAQLYHAVNMFAHPRIYRNGSLTEVTGTVTVEFEPPLGRIEMAFTDHPEVYTLPKYFDGLTQVRNAGALYPKLPVAGEEIGRLYRRITDEIGETGQSETVEDTVVKLLNQTREGKLEVWDEQDVEYEIGGTKIEIQGLEGGERSEYVFSSIGRGMSGTPRTLMTVTKMVANGMVAPGSYAPEGCIDPEEFIREFSGGGLTLAQTPQSYRLSIVEN
ncbi:saccharopine dehydrogenase family protein [Natronococcus wangiae]|uniref:saccharopine dehydrogenase family protein n=1 Tax=Natronococcus wangiae TaxID=3068275 RepID=UPI00273DE723|nr:saccharopine dehydrogenase NADP-binding domain-containing protein [Natronococcus sp. AD5]